MAQDKFTLRGADIYVQCLLTHCHIKVDYLVKEMQY